MATGEHPEAALEEVRGLWIGPRLSNFEKLCIRSFQDHGHPFRLFTYEPVEGIPPGTVVEDGRGILPEKVLSAFRHPGASLAHFADWFRWELLRLRGGWWVDMDIVCIRPFRFDAPVVFGYQDPETPNVAVLKFPEGHPLTEAMVARCRDPMRIRPGDSPQRKIRKLATRLTRNPHARLQWGEAGGPGGFKEELGEGEVTAFGLPYPAFYPVHHQHWKCLFDATLKDDLDFFRGTAGLHLWREVFNQHAGQGPDGTFHPDSVFEQLKARHGVAALGR